MSENFRRLGILFVIIAASALAVVGIQTFGGTEGYSDDGIPPLPLPDSYSFGLELAGLGDWSGAARVFEEAHDSDPNAPPILFALGTAYTESGRRLRGAVYLNAYLEAWPEAPNSRAVKLRIREVLTPYYQAARAMMGEAVNQLYGIANDEARALRSQAMAGWLIDVGPEVSDYVTFAEQHPTRITAATLDNIIARGTGLFVPETAHALLVTAINAEAGAAAEDIKHAGCIDGSPYAAPEVCDSPSVISRGADDVQACYDAQAGVGATKPLAVRGNRDAFASYLNFYAAAHLWAYGADRIHLVYPLLSDYAALHSRARQQGSGGDFWPRYCLSWPHASSWPNAGGSDLVTILHLSDESGFEAWARAGGRIDFGSGSRIDFGSPPRRPAGLHTQFPALQSWRAVVAKKRIDVGPDRRELGFDDPVFGDLSDNVRTIGGEPAEARPERLASLALRLGLLVQRLNPP